MKNTIYPYYNRETKTIYLRSGYHNTLTDKVLIDIPSKVKMNFYATAVTEEESIEIEKGTKHKKNTKEREKLQEKYPNINIDYIIATGNANEKGSTILGTLLFVREPNHYSKSILPRWRSYERTYEEWNDNALVNPCPDKRMSYESVLRKLGAKEVHGLNNSRIPFYMIFWADTISEDEITFSHGL